MTNPPSGETKFEVAVSEPRDRFSCFGISSGQQERVVVPVPEADDDLRLGDADVGAGIHEVAKEGAGLLDLEAVADSLDEQSLQQWHSLCKVG